MSRAGTVFHDIASGAVYTIYGYDGATLFSCLFQAHIPAPLTEEMEAEKRQRDAEKKKLQNQKRKEKMKERKAQQKIEDAAKKEKEREEEERQRYLQLSDREKVIPMLPSLR